MLAALQGAILLIAAKRMDAISAAQARRDLATDIAAKEEIEVLMQQNERQLKDIAELRVLLEKRLK
jgi:tryptophan 2,3-dioxygenase